MWRKGLLSDGFRALQHWAIVGFDRLPVRKNQQQLLVHVRAEQERALPRTGGAQVEDFATEGSEVFGFTAGIVALDSGDAFCTVARLQESLKPCSTVAL